MDKHTYICRICEVVAEKSDCAKRKVGCVFVNTDYEILVTGLNGPPTKFPHCDWHMGVDKCTCGNPCTRNIHAEQNAIAQAAKRGVVLKGSMVYCSYLPCITCARLLVQVGVRAMYVKETNSDGGLEVLRIAKIPVVRW